MVDKGNMEIWELHFKYNFTPLYLYTFKHIKNINAEKRVLEK